MKMTMHIDAALLARVIREYGFASKTEAVDASLREMDRRSSLRTFGERGLGFSPAELRDSVDPDYDLTALRGAEIPRRPPKKK